MSRHGEGVAALLGSAQSAAPAPSVSVDRYAGDRDEWDRLVHCTAGGTFFHLIGWKEVVEDAFGFTADYLLARRGQALVGVLPLFELGSRLAGRCLLSLPFAVEGGICATDDEARHALEAAALQLGAARKVRYIELRDGLDGSEFHVREGLYYCFRRPLADTDEENLAAIPRKQRRMVRVGQQSGLVSRTGGDDLDAFYDLYARSVRHLGTPVFQRRYFRLLLQRWPEESLLLTVWRDGTPVAGVLSFFFNDTVLPYYAGSRREFYRYAVNDFMYWELMRLARARGARVFDFGRSKKGTGAYEFKCHWGFEPEPLRYRVYTPDGAPLHGHSASDAHVQMLRRVWQRLPLGITKMLGPYIVRRYGAHYT